jgi:hypothetical protein
MVISNNNDFIIDDEPEFESVSDADYAYARDWFESHEALLNSF